MGYKFVKHLESANYNRKLFFLDRGAIDLPPITNLTDIMPGSEARSLSTGEKWVLNTHYKWVWIGVGDGCCGGNTSSGGAGGSNEPLVPGEEPSIEGVTLTPMNITVGPGASIQFRADIKGDSALNQGITWSVKGQRSPNTKITADGILTVAVTETSKSITVRATSQGDTSMYAQAIVTVDEEIEDPLAPIITNVILEPANVKVIRGQSFMFRATLAGANLTNAAVVWKVENNTASGTVIDEDGILTVSFDELAALLTVTATARDNFNVSAKAVVSTISEAEAEDPILIDRVEVIPGHVEVGQGYNTQLAAVVYGTMNPPQDVVWKIVGALDANTRITENGLLTIGETEKLGTITVLAYAQYDPTKYGECFVRILSKDAPGVADPKVTAVIVTPDMIEMTENSYKVFSAVVIGNNSPNQAVTWALEGATVATTYHTEQGVLAIGMGETADTLFFTATSVQDKTKSATATIGVREPTSDETGIIEEIPKAPLDAKYVRHRLPNGDAAWTQVIEEEEVIEQPDPEIRDIDINPQAVTVAPGSVISYTVTMDKTGDLNDEVIWSIQGNNSPATNITPDGILYIDTTEDSQLISVRATSVLDSTKYGRATVAVDENAPMVTMITGVKVIPNQTELIRGHSMKFQAVVTGVNVSDDEVTWSLVGNNNDATFIGQDGILVSSSVESSRVLVVTATAKADPTQSGTCVVSIVLPEEVENPYEITGIVIEPDSVSIGQGYNSRLAAVVTGVGNPPQDVVWSVIGATSPQTHVSQEGLVFVGETEPLTPFRVRATPVYAPHLTADATVIVLSKDTPGVAEVTIDSVVLTPGMVEAAVGDKITFQATVLGQNNPSQQVNFTLSGNNSAQTTINKLGVLEIARTETGKALTVRATSAEDNTKFATAYVTITKDAATPETGIEDVPALPLGREYVRARDVSGVAVWKEHIAGAGGRGGYVGTFNTYAELAQYDIPADNLPGDFAIVIKDESRGYLPAMYVLDDNGAMVFETLLAKRYTLGNKLDVLYVLDNQVHSTYLEDIEVLGDFDLNEERVELWNSPSAWHLVTNLHPGFWNEVKSHPDWYKMIVGMSNETGEVTLYLTCFLDDEHEFVYTRQEGVENPDPIENILDWTNTVGKGDTFTASNGNRYVYYHFNQNDFTLEVFQSTLVTPDTVPGVSPWATVIGEYTHLANGEIIGPLAGVTDPTGYLWISEKENFMIGSAGDGTQMFCYNIDTDTWFIFDTPAGEKAGYQMAYDINERYFMFYIDQRNYIFGDRVAMTAEHRTWWGGNSSGLSEPGADTRPSISTDGKWYLHTSTNPQTAEFYIENIETGEMFNQDDTSHNSGTDGTSACSTQFEDGRIVFNNVDGLIGCFTLNSETGTLTQLYRTTPFEGHYVQHNTGYNNLLLYIKTRAQSGSPAWYVFNPYTQAVIDRSEYNGYFQHLNPPGKTCVYPIFHGSDKRWLAYLSDGTGLLIELHNGDWIETEIPFEGLGNDAHTYAQPLLLDNGRVLVCQQSDGSVVAYDVVNKVVVSLGDLMNGNNPNIVQLDDNHFMWCTDSGSQLLRIENGVTTVVLEIPEQQVLVYGFGN